PGATLDRRESRGPVPHAVSRNRAGDSNLVAVRLGRTRQTDVRGQGHPLRGASGAEPRQEAGISGDARGNLTGLQEGRVSGLQNLPRLKRRVQLNRVGRIHERLASHSCRASARVRIDAVNDTEVQRTSQRRLNRVQNLLKHTKLVILIRPLKLIGDTNGLLELERL